MVRVVECERGARLVGTVDLIVEDPRWDEWPLLDLAERALGRALEAAEVSQNVEVALLATSDAAIADLNSRFRGKSSATNVLSWPAFDLFPERAGALPRKTIPTDPFGAPFLGDIALAFETVVEESRQQSRPAEDHILHLILHGSLHLLGYDHETEADATIMEGLEVRALASEGIATPY